MGSPPRARAERRVMIVDEHEIARRGVRVVVEALPGFTVCAEAGCAEDARAAAASTAPDIVVLDLRLANGAGVELIRYLRTARPAPEILVLSMLESERLQAEAFEAGAGAYLLKSQPSRLIADALLALAAHKPYTPAPGPEDDEGRASHPRGPLTRREREVVSLVASGASNRRIAETLAVSIKTVETHRSSAMHKIGASTVADVVRYAVRNQLI